MSRYLRFGAPKVCANAACQKVLSTQAWRCDQSYYCDETCAVEAANSGLKRIERFARLVS